MPRGGARLGAGRKPTNPKTIAKKAAAGHTTASGQKALDAPSEWPFGKDKPAETSPAPALAAQDPNTATLTPLEYMLMVVRDLNETKAIRLQAAIQAAPYIHSKPAPLGKKETKAAVAKEAGKGRFKSAPPPLKLVNGDR